MLFMFYRSHIKLNLLLGLFRSTTSDLLTDMKFNIYVGGIYYIILYCVIFVSLLSKLLCSNVHADGCVCTGS